MHPAGFHGPKPPGVSQGSLQVHPHASPGEQPCGDQCPAQDLEELGRLPAVSVTDLRRCICNQAAEEKNRLYCRIRDLCATNGCSHFQAASRCDQSSSSVARQLTCRTTQEMCRLDDYRYENFTRAGCGWLAKLPEQSLLLHAREPQGQLCDLVAQNDDAQKEVVARGLPTIATGQGPVFPLAPGASPVEAIQYVDGDGGHIVTQFFLPGLLRHLREQPSTVCLDWHE